MFFLAAQIFLWIAIAFVVGALLGWWYGRSSSFMLDDTTYSPKKETGGGSIKVLSDSLLETQRELQNCQQSLVVAESKLKEMDLRFEKKEHTSALVVEDEKPVDEVQKEVSADEFPVKPVMDDLTLIHGIGPYIQGKLREMNISSFRQIAHLTDADINKIEETINYFPGRIARDGWKESAKVLHEKKYGEMV